MRLLVTVLALVALLAPQAAQAERGRVDTFAQRAALTHGIAGDERYVFTTEPGVGIAPSGARVVVLDRFSGREVATLPAPEGGFKLPFTLRVPRTGHLVVLDSGGFPPVGPPVVYDYRYSARHGFTAELTRTTSFAGKPMGFAEDVEVLPNGEYVVSESIFGGLWLIGRDGGIRRGLVPDDGAPPLAKLGPCQFSGPGMVGELAFEAPGGFAPGAGSLAVRGANLYVSSTCEGGVQRVPIRVLLDTSRPAAERAARIETVTPRRHPLESLKGITFNRWDPSDPWIYAGDPFQLMLIRIDSRTGRREVLSNDRRRFDFTVSTAFLPPVRRGKPNPLVTASDQEYRWSATNAALGGVDAFQPPFVLAEFYPSPGALKRSPRW
jgi:hypothetical protein